MSDDWDFEAIDLPAGCWVHSKTGDLLLPGGSVVGKLSESGLRALDLYLDDLARLSPPSEETAMTEELRDMAREAASKLDDIHFNGRTGSWMENAEKIVLAALLRAKESGEREATARAWQLIETAPKDGSRILACNSITGYVDVVKWAPKFSVHHYPVTDAGWYSYILDRRIDVLTHWMPMPSAAIRQGTGRG